jgi:UDP-N-acetylglucosamine transferase subunit ALG13
VCQGADTILDVLRAGKPALAVPRQRQYREAVNDHQVEFVEALAARGLVTVLKDPESGMADGIERAAVLPVPSLPVETRLAGAIRELVDDWFANRRPRSE